MHFPEFAAPVRRGPFYLFCLLAVVMIAVACSPAAETEAPAPTAESDTTGEQPPAVVVETDSPSTESEATGERLPSTEEDTELRRAARAMGSEGLVAPVMLTNRLPEYTAEATQQQIQGEVYIEAVVTIDGSVAEPRLIRGLPDDELNRRAMDAIGDWTFDPGTVDGEPVPVIALFTVTFKVE